MRREFTKVMEELMKKDERVYLLTSDYEYGLYTKLKKEFPKRCINTGIREQSTIGMASGMALEGLKPYVFSITPFFLERAFEQIKLDVVQQDADVKIITYWSYPTAGITHETKNPRGLCKILGLTCFMPNNYYEVRKQLLSTHKGNKPAFFYLTKDGELQ